MKIVQQIFNIETGSINNPTKDLDTEVLESSFNKNLQLIERNIQIWREFVATINH